MFGLPDAPYVVVPYTMTSRSRDEAASDVEAVFDDLVVGMTTQPIPSNGYSPQSAIRAADTESFEGPTVWMPGAFSIGSTWIEDWATVFH